MTLRAWPILIALVPAIVLAGCQASRSRRPVTSAPMTAVQECDSQLYHFKRTLGSLRQYPGALSAWMYGHDKDDKLDYGMCYNQREQLKRNIAIADWKKTASPVCQKHFRDQDMKFAARYSIKRESLEKQVADYNDSCSHTMAGTL